MVLVQRGIWDMEILKYKIINNDAVTVFEFELLRR